MPQALKPLLGLDDATDRAGAGASAGSAATSASHAAWADSGKKSKLSSGSAGCCSGRGDAVADCVVDAHATAINANANSNRKENNVYDAGDVALANIVKLGELDSGTLGAMRFSKNEA